MHEQQLRDDLVRFGKSLFDRGYSVGTAGNISVKLEDGFLMTPTNSCLGFLNGDRIAKLDENWNLVSGDKPSKEVFLHRAFYETRPTAGAVVHLHSTYATAISCLKETNASDCIPPITPYVVMRAGTVKMVPYVIPGDPKTGDHIRALNGECSAILLENHGPVVSAKDLASAVYTAEELEETAKLLVVLKGQDIKYLPEHEVALLRAKYANM